jgi:hypothetical protein
MHEAGKSVYAKPAKARMIGSVLNNAAASTPARSPNFLRVQRNTRTISSTRNGSMPERARARVQARCPRSVNDVIANNSAVLVPRVARGISLAGEKQRHPYDGTRQRRVKDVKLIGVSVKQFQRPRRCDSSHRIPGQ